jgi:hypothetical protein
MFFPRDLGYCHVALVAKNSESLIPNPHPHSPYILIFWSEYSATGFQGEPRDLGQIPKYTNQGEKFECEMFLYQTNTVARLHEFPPLSSYAAFK